MRTGLAICFLLLSSVGRAPQSPPATSDVAHKRLEYFVGQWKIEGAADGTQGEKPHAYSGTQRCEWFETSLVLCRTQVSSSSGDSNEIMILGYNPILGVYTRYNVQGRSGENGYATGNVQGDVWQWIAIQPATPKIRFSWTEVSPDVLTVQVSVNDTGDSFTTVVEGKATRLR